MKKLTTLLAASALIAGSAHAQLLITQYYEGASTNKWIEITNVSDSEIADLSSYYLTLWSNANTEAWKTDGTPSESMALSGSLAAGQSLILGNTNNGTEISYLGSYTPQLSSNQVINFNGDDSVVLYSSATFTTGNILDAISFTDLGSEGSNTSIIRLNANVGYSLVAGSTFEDFSSVWSDIGMTAAQNATAGTDNYLSYSSVAVPEPGTYAALAGLMALGLVIVRRRR